MNDQPEDRNGKFEKQKKSCDGVQNAHLLCPVSIARKITLIGNDFHLVPPCSSGAMTIITERMHPFRVGENDSAP
jgi:hypothetical protein